MSTECNFSFSDLYKAAFGKPPSKQYQEKFMRFTQGERNDCVRQWAERAGWETEERMGSDEQMYLAFAPSFSG